jgi:hypothetical protein
MDFDYPFGIFKLLLNKNKNGKELFILLDIAVLVIVVH